MKIGIEVELHCPGTESAHILSEDMLSYTEFKLIPGTSVGVKMSEEYYPNTIEYNFSIFENVRANFNTALAFLEEKKNKWRMVLNNQRPAFVGTHIHIFEPAYINKSKKKILAGTLAFIANNFEGLSTLALERVLCAHQLWGYWSHKNGHKWAQFMGDNGYRYTHYDVSHERPKYAPIIRSLATASGKPLSLEVRIIPNEFMFNGLAHELMNKIEDGSIYREQLEPVAFFQKVHEELRRRRALNNERQQSRYVEHNSIYDRIYLRQQQRNRQEQRQRGSGVDPASWTISQPVYLEEELAGMPNVETAIGYVRQDSTPVTVDTVRETMRSLRREREERAERSRYECGSGVEQFEYFYEVPRNVPRAVRDVVRTIAITTGLASFKYAWLPGGNASHCMGTNIQFIIDTDNYNVTQIY